MKVRKMRILRLKYGISLADMARVCGITKQRISHIELGKRASVEPETAARILRGFTGIIEERRLAVQGLEQDFKRQRATLMDYVEEHDYEL